MDSDHCRKRKRLTRPTISITTVRSLIVFSTIVSFLYLYLHRISLGVSPAVFRPLVVVSKFPVLASRSSRTARLYSGSSVTRVVVGGRVLFPDHVLVIVSNRGLVGSELECVYSGGNPGNGNSFGIGKLRRKVLSFDDYNGFESIVRCPIQPPGYSGFVNLEGRTRGSVDLGKFGGVNRRVVHSWGMLAYTATLDRNTAVVFVKGLNLRPDREADPNQISCHFGFGNWETNGKYVLTTRAITAAQEVVRCRLPRSIKTNPNKAHGMRVTIGLARGRGRTLVPSVARIYNTKKDTFTEKKHELCVCTMVWNQASVLREWVMYHSWLGVGRWFIYDNNSDDGIEKLIDELENYNISRHVWPWIKTQEAGFSHCALRARDECNWVGFMDVDEYFHFPISNFRNQGSKELSTFPGQNSLRTLVANYTSTTIAEIRTSCHSFGPSGLSLPPPQGVMIGYTCRLQSPERHKSIVRPEALDLSLLNVVHHFRTKKRFRYINLPQNTAVINHYKYQVWESFRAKFYRRVATYVADWQENQNEGSRDRAPGLGTEPIEPANWRLRFCEIWDTGLRDFVLAHLADPVSGSVPWERNSS